MHATPALEAPATAPLHADRVRLRPCVRGDESAVTVVFEGMSSRSRFLRYHAGVPRLTAAARRALADTDGDRHVGIVAEAPGPGGWVPVGLGRYVRTGPATAELAIEVVDAWQGRGVGARLLTALRDTAAAGGIDTVIGDVLPANGAMLRLLRRVFPAVVVVVGADALHVRCRVAARPAVGAPAA